MKKRKNKHILPILLGVVVILGITTYWLFLSSLSKEGTPSYIYIRTGDNADSVYAKIEAAASPRQMLGLKILSNLFQYNGKVKAGRYQVGPNISTLALFRNLRNGRQVPVQLVVPNVRTMNDMAARLSKQLSVDSATWAEKFMDADFCAEYGCDTTTLACLFIPNTYEVFWNISPEQLVSRMQKESKAFWTTTRKEKAKAIGLTENEIITLASIVDQETANNKEKPMIAGMYLNRLRQGMKLQADPTVKFALKDFSLRRIMHEHLSVKSPYNTYMHEGLPPGPIAIPSIASIDAVLDFARHDYLYMCAKEDFSGTHNFATTYEEHLSNARRYTKALDERNIRK